jgi:uncharacterized protein DUF4434
MTASTSSNEESSRQAATRVFAGHVIPFSSLLLFCLLPTATALANDTPVRVSAAFVDPGAFIPGLYPAKRSVTETDVRAKVNALNAVGIKTIVITYVHYISNKWGPFYPSEIPELKKFANPLKFDLVKTIMEQADKNGQSVMLGIGRGGDPLLTYNGCKDAKRLRAGRLLAEKVVRELHGRYAARHRCFGGWYLTHECRDIRYASAYYNPVADLCHKLTSGQPVMIAPDGSPVADTKVIAESDVDIFSYQDAVGAGFVPGPKERYSYDPEKRLAKLDEVFQKYARWHAKNPKKQIWADVELWQMDGPKYTGAYPADWSRVERQLEAVRKHVSKIIVYEAGGFLESPGSDVELGGKRAVKLYQAYQTSLGGKKTDRSTALGATWQ